MLVAPVVHLQNGIFHAQTLHTVFQFLVKLDARIVKRLVVHTQWQHKVAEQQFRHGLPPCHFLLRLESGTHII